MTPTIHMRSTLNTKSGIDGMSLFNATDIHISRRNDEECACLFTVECMEDEPEEFPPPNVTQFAIEWDKARWQAFKAYIDAAFESMEPPKY